MYLLDGVILLSLIGTPIAAGFAWRLWLRKDRVEFRGSRRVVILVGLLAASANAAMYYAWLIYRLATGSTPLVWRIRDGFGNIGDYLVLLAIAGAIAGEGYSRIPVAACAVLGFMNWVRFGV